MEYQQSVNDTLLSTISDSELGGVTTDLAEVAIDLFIKDGVLKEIPIIRTIIGLYNGAVAIRDQIFLKKVVHFLSAMKDVPAEVREEMFVKLEKQGHSRYSVGETLLLILDKVDNYNKARLLGLLLKSLSTSVIDYNDFERFSSILANVFIQDLLNLPKYSTELTTSNGNHLEAHNLIMRKSILVDEYAEEYTYQLSPLGKRFCKAIEIM